MTIRKQYLKTKKKCKVTFILPGEIVSDAKSVHIVGDFNDWNEIATPMKHLRKGDFTTTLDLDVNREYQFRYLLDKGKWMNDDNPDALVFNSFANCNNCLIRT